VFKTEGRWLLVAYLAGATCLFTLFGILFFLSDILEKQYKIDGVIKGLILAIPLLVMGTSSYITGAKIGKNQVTMKRMIVLGFTLMTISYVFLSFFNEKLIPFLFILVLSSIGTGFVLPCLNSLITGSVGKEKRGFVTSLYGSVRFIGVAIGPPIFTRLMEWSQTGMFLTIAALTFVVGFLSLTLIHAEKSGGSPNKGKQKQAFRYNYV
jgi:ACDE family multidrug resistance protein